MSKKNNFLSKIQPHLRSNDTYQGVITTAQMSEHSGKDIKSVIRLNANENPYGANEKIKQSLQRIDLHLYPDPNQTTLRKALSDYTDQPEERLMAGAGGDEIIDLLMRLFVSPGDMVLDCNPTFGMYSFSAKLAGAKLISIPRKHDWAIDLERIIEHSNTSKIIFIASPNNPTGNLLSESEAMEILDSGILLVVDETYFEFSNNSLANLTEEYDNLIILRSFSKWAGIAGLRVGYAISSPDLTNILMAIKQPYNINVAGEIAAITALNYRDDILLNVKNLLEQRTILEKFVKQYRPKINYYPSHGNFLLCHFENMFASDVYKKLVSEGIFVRTFSDPLLSKCVRISSGTTEQTDRLLGALKNIVIS